MTTVKAAKLAEMLRDVLSRQFPGMFRRIDVVSARRGSPRWDLKWQLVSDSQRPDARKMREVAARFRARYALDVSGTEAHAASINV